MSQIQKYWEQYNKRQKEEHGNPARFLTDKKAYIEYLETQIEKITKTELLNRGIIEKIDQLQYQINTTEDKILNLTRLIKLQQTYTEQQEEEFQSFRQKFADAPSNDSKFKKTLEKVERGYVNLSERMEVVENKLVIDLSEQGLSGFAQQINETLAEAEGRIKQVLNQASYELDHKYSAIEKGVEQSIQYSLHEFQYTLQEVQQKLNGMQGQGRFEEGAGDVKQRLGKIEASFADINQLKSLLAEEAEVRRAEFFEMTEKLSDTEAACAKLIDSAQSRVEDCEKELQDLNEKITNVLAELKSFNSKFKIEAIEKKIVRLVGENMEKVQKLVQNSLKIQKNIYQDLDELKSSAASTSKSPLGTPKRQRLTMKFNSPSAYRQNSGQEEGLTKSIKELEDALSPKPPARSSSAPARRRKRTPKKTSSRSPKAKKAPSPPRPAAKQAPPQPTQTQRPAPVSRRQSYRQNRRKKLEEVRFIQLYQEMSSKGV